MVLSNWIDGLATMIVHYDDKKTWVEKCASQKYDDDDNDDDDDDGLDDDNDEIYDSLIL